MRDRANNSEIGQNTNENYFSWWAEDLMAYGLVLEIIFEPETFVICDHVPMYVTQNYKTKDSIIKTKTFYDQLVYTPDFLVYMHPLLLHNLFGLVDYNTNLLKNDPNMNAGNVYQNTLFYCTVKDTKTVGEVTYYGVYFEVKPPNNDTGAAVKAGEFRYKNRLMYERHLIIVNKVVPVGSKNSLFSKTFFPNRYLLQDSGKSERRKRDASGQLVPLKDLNLTMLPDWIRKKGIDVGNLGHQPRYPLGG